MEGLLSCCLLAVQMVLDNGLRVFLLEDHEVPLVKGTLLMKGGARASPPDKVWTVRFPLLSIAALHAVHCVRSLTCNMCQKDLLCMQTGRSSVQQVAVCKLVQVSKPGAV